MGSLLNEIQNKKPKVGGSKSKIPALLETMDKQDAQDLLVALADLTIQSQVISTVLTQRGFVVSRQCVSRFRKANL